MTSPGENPEPLGRARPLPELDASDLADIIGAQDVMRELIATIPRRFGYSAEFEFVLQGREDA